MSKSISPTAIGGFTIGAVLLLISGLFLFGGESLFNPEKQRYVVFFESSLNGLEIGAPVKMQGVKVGQVTDIALQFDKKRDKLFKPVVIEIEPKRISGSGASPLPVAENEDDRKAQLDKLVALGFRARLELQSFLTGLLYVDLDVYPNKPALFAGLNYQNLMEIPGIPTTADELRNTAEEVVEKLKTLPLDQIVRDFAESLHEIRSLLASEDLKKTQVSLANTLQQVETTLAILNRNLEPLLRDSHATIVNSEHLVKDTQAVIAQLHAGLPQILVSADTTLAAATAALNQAESSLQSMGNAVGPDSSLNATMNALKQAARAIRDLSDYLQQHPEALLTGKDD